MQGRTLEVTMLGFPTAWECGQCRDFENALTGQLKAIGIAVTVRHEADWPGPAFASGSTIDLVPLGSGTDLPDPVALIGELRDVPWLGEANLAELARLRSLGGQARIDGAVAFAHRVVDEQGLVLPVGSPLFPFLISERIGCGYVQPAIGAVDLLSLCVKDGASAPTATPSAPPASSASPTP
jgi:hypothetical protein